jgi:hypothetical protein
VIITLAKIHLIGFSFIIRDGGVHDHVVQFFGLAVTQDEKNDQQQRIAN